MAKPSKFWDRIADRYSRQPIADEASYQKKLRITREHFQPHMQVLEIGCGTGSTAITHAPYVKHICAVDGSSKMIDIAQRRAKASGVQNVSFKCCSIDELSVPDQTLDMVLGLSILHLLDNTEEVIVKVHRMLKPGGVFVSSTVCIADTMKFIKLIAPIGNFLGVMPYVNVFTSKKLVDALINAGFTIDYQWQPGNGKGLFIVAKKSE